MKGCKIILLVIFILNANCRSTLTKTQYLESYCSFIENIKFNYTNYTESDWVEADQQFENFSNTLYDKFKAELKESELLQTYRYKFVYNLIRGNINLTSLINGEYNSALLNNYKEVLDVMKQVSFYKKDIKDVLSIQLINKILQ